MMQPTGYNDEMSENNMPRVIISAPQDWIDRLDLWRGSKLPLLSRAEAIRRLVEERLDQIEGRDNDDG